MFDPSKLGVPITTSGFDPSKLGAPEIENQQPQGTQSYPAQVFSNIGQSFQNRSQDIINAYKGTTSSNPASTGLQTVGAIAGTVGDIIGSVVKPPIEYLGKKIGDIPAVSRFATSKAGDVLAKAGTSTADVYSSWAQRHPEASKNLESAINIGALLAGEKVAPEVQGGIKTGIKSLSSTVKGAITNEAKVAEKSFADVLNVVTPKLNKAETISALEKGQGITQGILKTTKIAPAAQDIAIAKASQGVVSTKNNPFQNVNALRAAIKNEAENVVAGLSKDKSIVNPNQIISRFNAIERPVAIASDSTLNRAYTLVQKKMVDLVKNNEGTLNGVLSARKQFDTWVERQFGNLYGTEKWSPMRNAITDIRTAANDFISERLPNGSIFKDSLNKQSLMYRAIDNIATKSYKEVGKNVFNRFGHAHPTITNILKFGVPTAIGIQEVKRILGK